MSVYIRGIEMPTNATGCEVIIRIQPDGTVLNAQGIYLYAKAAPVQPHGRLIDADELHSVLRKRGKEFSDSEYGTGVKCGLADAREYIKMAPTIIPASKEG